MNPDDWTMRSVKDVLSVTNRQIWNSMDLVVRARQGFKRTSITVANAEIAYARSKAVLARIDARIAARGEGARE